MGFFISSYLYTNACELCNIPVSLQRMNPTSTSVMYTCLWSYWLAPGISGIPNEDGNRFLFRKNRLLQFKQLLPIWTFGNKNRKIQKKIFETLEQTYIVLREMFFYCYLFQSTKQRWKRKAPWRRHVSLTLLWWCYLKIWFEKKMFLVPNLRYFSK